MKMYDPIRIGMIGSGHIAGSHAACWQNEAVITAVCSRQRSKAEQLARKFDIPVVCDDIPSLLNHDDVDAVGITTPPHLHHPIAMQAMQAGKHVFCEKPLALTGEEARQMVEMAEKTGVKTGVQSGMRHFKSLRHLRQIIKQGTLGQIFSFHGAWSFDWAKDPKFPLTWRFKRDEAGTGVLGDLGVYLIDIARWLLGEINSVCGDMNICIAQRPPLVDYHHFGELRRRSQAGMLKTSPHLVDVENEDVCHLLLRFENGVSGTIRSSRLHVEHEIKIEGERASYVWHFKPDQLLCRKAGETDYSSVTIPDTYSEESMVTPFLNNIRQNKNEPPTFYDGMKAQVLMDAVVQSDRDRCWVDV